MTERLDSKLWEVPDFSEQQKPEEGETNALNMPLKWRFEPPEADEEALQETLELPTAEALEAIREAARLEGFEAGQQAGFTQGQQAGYDAGFEQGLQSGQEAGEAEAKEANEQIQKALSQHWESMLEGLLHPLKQVDQAVENQLVHLAIHLARAICWAEVKTNPDIIKTAFQKGIHELSLTAQRVEIYLHAEDYKVIDSTWDEKTRADKGWFIYTDPLVKQGGCRIQTPLAAIDTSMESRMSEVFNHLIEGLRPIPENLPPHQKESQPPEGTPTDA